ncbi:erythromycin esterase [Saccharothrix sp. NRRL B-16348]|uniref:erythromycin esterase family protein n=1 Tax=Saccharothrix sp. NRRL B-16348 TaxID=1415542 RepID=UPI0006AF5CAC|nr:erythromycin esterase family protein [Saccharothrix sp. NRRL B-16348]KOX18003.1 erythromycin esterase [Saccharothrix sp. NRRL B-16348]
MTTNTTTARLSDEAVIPLRTLDPAQPLDDLEWLDEAIGDARVVAIGESAHYNREAYQLRHRLLRYLVERHGFSAYAMETGFAEGRLTDSWVRGGDDRLGHVMANGVTSLMGLWTQMGAHLEWMRQHNRTAAHPVGFHGIDLGGSNASLLPALDAVIAYLAQADDGFRVDPVIRDTAEAFAAMSAFSAPASVVAYGNLAAEHRDALTAGLADLTARMTARRFDYVPGTSVDAYERALRCLRIAVTLDSMFRSLIRGDQRGMMMSREATIADTVDWILGGEGRIVVAAHDAHVQRQPAALPGMSPATVMGVHLADRLGADYRVIGTTTGTGWTLSEGADFYAGEFFQELSAPRPDSLDGLMAASHHAPFATDLRRLSPADTATVQAVTRQRYGTFYSDLNPLDAYDVIVHLPHVTPAEPDHDALAHSPLDVREAFSRWQPE